MFSPLAAGLVLQVLSAAPASLDIVITIDARGDAEIAERFVGFAPPFARRVEPGAVGYWHWTIRQATLLDAKTPDGRDVPMSVRSGAGASVFEAATWPEIPEGVSLRYRVERFAVGLGGGGAELESKLLGGSSPRLDSFAVTVRVPGSIAPNDLAFVGPADAPLGGDFEQPDPHTVRFTAQGALEADAFVTLKGALPSAAIRPWTALEVWRAYVPQVAPYHWLIVALFLFAVAARTRGARSQVALIHAAHAVSIALLVVIVVGLVADDLHEWRAHRSALNTAVFEIALVALLGVLFGAMLGARSLAIVRRERTALLAEAAVFGLFVPLLTLIGGIPLLPLVALASAAPLLVWSSGPLKLELGAATETIVEKVILRGQVTLAELASELSVTPRALRRLLSREIDLPLVFERGQDRVLSAAVAAEHGRFSICRGCGGATEITGQAISACPYCDRVYGFTADRARPRTPPVIVAGVSELARNLLVGSGLLVLAVGAAVLILDWFFASQSSLGLSHAVVVVVVAAIPMGVGFFLASRWKKGERYLLLLASVAMTAPMVVPLFAFARLRSPLVRVHFGALSLVTLAGELDRRGTWPLEAFAAHLGCRYDEASDLACVLAVNEGVAIYDRRAARLVSRKAFETLCGKGSCTRCGGIFGIVPGGVRCQHWGA